MFLQAAIGHVAAITREFRWLREISDDALFVWIAEDEFSCLERPARARRGLFPRALDYRLGQAVPEAEVIVGVVERRCGVQVEMRQHSHPGASLDQLPVHGGAPVMLGIVAGE